MSLKETAAECALLKTLTFLWHYVVWTFIFAEHCPVI